MSSSGVTEYQTEAGHCMPLLAAHKSEMFVEKLIRGMAKQFTSESDAIQKSEATKLLLNVLNFPDANCQLLGYASLLSLVTNSLGVTQAANTKLSRSYRCLILLQPRVMNFLIFSGCSHTNKKVAEMSREILLTLIRSCKLMAPKILKENLLCLKSCFLNLGLLVSSTSTLGRAILNLPSFLNDEGSEIADLEVFKFHLRGMFSKEKEVRELSFRNAMAFYVMSQQKMIGPSLSKIDMDGDAHIFIGFTEVDVLATVRDGNENFQTLVKAVELLKNGNLHQDLQTSLWKQFAFLLQNPSFHANLQKLYPVSRILKEFLSMMQISGGKSVTVSQVPAALEVLRHCILRSTELQELCDHTTLLLAVLRAALFYKEDVGTVQEAALLLSLILFNDLQEHPTLDDAKQIPPSLPQIVSSQFYIPFKCKNFEYQTKTDELSLSLCNILPIDSRLLFLKNAWAIICADHPYYSPKDISISKSFDLTEDKLEELILGQDFLYIQRLLGSIESATTHKQVKKCLNTTEALLGRISPEEKCKVLQCAKWTEPMARFLLLTPVSSQDRQIMFHVLNTVCELLKVVNETCKVTRKCYCCKLIDLLAGELGKEDSALIKVLLNCGCIDWKSSAHDMQVIQSKLTFQSTIEVIELVLAVSQNMKCTCTSGMLDWHNVFINVFKNLCKVVHFCQRISQFNLPLLVPSLMLMTKIAQTFDIGEDLTIGSITQLIKFLCEFNEGRNVERKVLLGRSVNCRCFLLLSVLLHKANTNYPQGDWASVVGSLASSMIWLNVALQHSDPYSINSALKLCISLSMTNSGAKFLETSLHDVPGDVWLYAMRLLLSEKCDNFVRTSSCQLLLRLSKCILVDRETNLCRSMSSISSSDQQNPGDVLIEAFKENGFFDFLRKIFRNVETNNDLDQSDVFIHSEQLADFVSSEESEWMSSLDVYEEEDEIGFHVSPELVESSIYLLANVIILNREEGISHISSSLILNVLIQKVAALTNETELLSYFGPTVLATFQLLLEMGEPFVSNTHVAPLAVFSFIHGQTLELQSVSLRLIRRMLSSGSWRSVRLTELFLQDSGQLGHMLIRFLHCDMDVTYRLEAFKFISELCSVGIGDDQTSEFAKSNLGVFFETQFPTSEMEEQSIGSEICKHLLLLLPSKIDHVLVQFYSCQNEIDSIHFRSLLEAIKQILLTKEGQNFALKQYLQLLNVIQFSLSSLWKKILAVNLHITSNIMNVKELKPYISFAMTCLNISTNWLHEADSESECSSFRSICEVLVPLLHPLWIPALRGKPLMDCILNFLLSASAHEKVCLVLTRTSTVPGATLSLSRTTKSLLTCIVSSTTQVLSRRTEISNPCKNDCGVLPQSSVKTSLDVLVHCSRYHESAYVMAKESLVKTIVNYLDRSKDGTNSIILRCLQIMACITMHPEARAALGKIPQWAKIIRAHLGKENYIKFGLITYINMVLNHQFAKNMLTTDDFIGDLSQVVHKATDNLVYAPDEAFDEESLHLVLVVLWSLVANNKRCKSILKKQNLLPHLEELCRYQRHSPVCKIVMDVLCTDH